jgi:hypothetical protein
MPWLLLLRLLGALNGSTDQADQLHRVQFK